MVPSPWRQLGQRVGVTLLRPTSAKLLLFSALSAGAYESAFVTVRQSTITVWCCPKCPPYNVVAALPTIASYCSLYSLAEYPEP
jgi:hypothetical protein